ncbi:MAG: hypothetical protein JWM64_517 [Frankiales bacterium]|nr:hypothetical protein [Frankiales bacterium]
MIETALPPGAGRPLVRGLAACLASVTELPLDALPRLADDTPPAHALAAWRGWLAGRGSGLVPVADPRSFSWAGWWIAVVDGSSSPSADGPDRQVACLAFGTPPGVVLSPQDPALLGAATAELSISSAYVVASLDPVVAPLPVPRPLQGTVERLAVAPRAEAPVRLVDSVRALAGGGLEGDRYAVGEGTFSPRAGHRPGYELTLFAAEVLDDLTAQGVDVDFARTRRNVLTRGLDLDALVGRAFRIGDVRCRGLRLAEPCVHLDRLSGPGLLRPLIHRGGLRAAVLTDGDLHVGDRVTGD